MQPHDRTSVPADLPAPANLLSVAQAIHMRRELSRAVSHGIALLDVLRLPRLVDDDFVEVDRVALHDALDTVVAHLDELDAPFEDLEDDDAAEDDNPAEDDGTGEPILGAPERHPWTWTPTVEHFRAADGSFRRDKGDSQASWAQGRNDSLNDGEAEPGYDLAEGDDERCGSGDVDAESSLGWPEDFTADVDPTAYASDAECDPTDCISRYLPVEAFKANERAGREAERQAHAIRQRVQGGHAPRPLPEVMWPVIR